MGFLEDLQSNLRGDSRRSSVAADRELTASLAKIWTASGVDLEALVSHLSDVEAYKILIAAVKVSKAKNEDLARLQARVTALGDRVVHVAKKAAGPL